MADFPITERNRIVRVPGRARYDETTIHSILDEGRVCHVAFADADGPVVVPMFYARRGSELLVHGANKGRITSLLESGATVSIAVTLLDGLVLARSAFHHSMNYRSVVLFGRGRRITDSDEIAEAVGVITDKVAPGRAADCRFPNAQELKATAILAVEIESASAKVRSGGPVDEPEDVTLPHWAGVVPMSVAFGEPLSDEHVTPGSELPGYLDPFRNR
ncbi:MAG: pyridoxamine 5'-phosphate oxidase family protein [Candidatus Eisenbacteria bacterium]|nr:pyridoxamine 5'-phosphate oxidase family protein [Candidatus Eisenbacteria bacterium]